MPEFMLQWIIVQHWMISWPALTFAILAFFSPYGKIHENGVDRKKWTGGLIQDRFKSHYKRIIAPWLDWLDETLSSDEGKRGLSPARTAWSLQLLHIIMMMAILYPILAVIAQWLAGTAITFGGETIIVAGTPRARLFVGLSLGLSSLLYIIGFRYRSAMRTALFIAASLICYTVLFLPDRFEVPEAVAGAVAVAYSGAVLVAGAVAFAGAVVVTYSVAGAVAVAFAYSVASAGAVASAVALAGAFAIARAVVVVQRDARLMPHPKRTIALIFLYLIALSCAIVLGSFDPERSTTFNAFVVLFVGVFPLFNMLADFASVGLTRYLLRQGLDGLSWWKALIDLLGGAVIFLCLGCAMITWVHFIRSSGEVSLMDLNGLFNGLRTSPDDYWWLAIMLATTLLPTLLHAAVGIFTCLITYPEFLRAWIVDNLSSGSATAGWRASLTICAMISLSIWVPLILFYQAVTINKGALRDGVVTIFESYARLIGAI